MYHWLAIVTVVTIMKGVAATGGFQTPTGVFLVGNNPPVEKVLEVERKSKTMHFVLFETKQAAVEFIQHPQGIDCFVSIDPEDKITTQLIELQEEKK